MEVSTVFAIAYPFSHPSTKKAVWLHNTKLMVMAVNTRKGIMFHYFL